MSKIVLKRIKKPGGGTRTQAVKIDSKGRWKFVKNTTKGMVRKTRAKGRLAFEKVKKKTKRESPTKRKSNKPRKRGSSNNMKLKLPSWARKAAIGLGVAQIAGLVAVMTVPQWSGIIKPVSAWAAGGIPALAAELVIDQGILNNVMGFFGGFGNQQAAVAQGGL